VNERGVIVGIAFSIGAESLKTFASLLHPVNLTLAILIYAVLPLGDLLPRT
jgi:galactitol-specific phosphotransferase system IIC component